MKALLRTLKKKFAYYTFSSARYWRTRYQRGGNSGPGSYGQLAQFKATVLNGFVEQHQIGSVIEFGCGDGNQLTLARYARYTGYDISSAAIRICRKKLQRPHWSFFLRKDYDGRKADLAMSLDVIFHLTEDSVFESYMRQLFNAADRYVAIYSSNVNVPVDPAYPHVRQRRFTDWIEQNLGADWALIEKIPNAFPFDGDNRMTSFADFYFYEKRLPSQ